VTFETIKDFKDYKYILDGRNYKIYVGIHDATDEQVKRHFQLLSKYFTTYAVLIPMTPRCGCLTYNLIPRKSKQTAQEAREAYIMNKIQRFLSDYSTKVKEFKKSGRKKTARMPFYGPIFHSVLGSRVMRAYSYLATFLLTHDTLYLRNALVPVTKDRSIVVLPNDGYLPENLYIHVNNMMVNDVNTSITDSETKYWHSSLIFRIKRGKSINMIVDTIEPEEIEEDITCDCGLTFPYSSESDIANFSKHIKECKTKANVELTVPAWAKFKVRFLVCSAMDEVTERENVTKFFITDAEREEFSDIALKMSDLSLMNKMIKQKAITLLNTLQEGDQIVVIAKRDHAPYGVEVSPLYTNGLTPNEAIDEKLKSFSSGKWGATVAEGTLNQSFDKTVSHYNTVVYCIPYESVPKEHRENTLHGLMDLRTLAIIKALFFDNHHEQALEMMQVNCSRILGTVRYLIVDCPEVLPPEQEVYACARLPFDQFKKTMDYLKKNKQRHRAQWLLRNVYRNQSFGDKGDCEMTSKDIKRLLD
jgi:hypothetical protein